MTIYIPPQQQNAPLPRCNTNQFILRKLSISYGYMYLQIWQEKKAVPISDFFRKDLICFINMCNIALDIYISYFDGKSAWLNECLCDEEIGQYVLGHCLNIMRRLLSLWKQVERTGRSVQYLLYKCLQKKKQQQKFPLKKKEYLLNEKN